MSMSTHNKLDQDNGVRGDGSTRTPKAQRSGHGNLTASQQQREQDCLKIREHHGVPYVAGLSVHRVTSALNILELLHEGSRNKLVASTSMNEASSRSHAIFQVMVEKSEVVASDGDRKTNGKLLTGKLTCVDLAGSERVKNAADWDTTERDEKHKQIIVFAGKHYCCTVATESHIEKLRPVARQQADPPSMRCPERQ